jgi:hypothetical protein
MAPQVPCAEPRWALEQVCLFACLFACLFVPSVCSLSAAISRTVEIYADALERIAAQRSVQIVVHSIPPPANPQQVQSSVRSEASALGDAMSRVEWLLCRASVCVCVCACVFVGVGVRACVTVSARWFRRSHWWRTVAQVRRIQIVEAFNETLEQTCRGTYYSCTMLASIGPECLHAVASKRTWASRSPNPAGLDTCCLRAAFRVLTFALDS